MADNCTAGHFTESQNDSIVGVVVFGAVLSLLGSGFIISSYVLFPRLRTFPYKLIMLLSIADFGASFSYLIGISNTLECAESGRCTFAALMNQFFGVASFMWTCVVAYNCHAVLVGQKGRAVESFEKFYHGVSWGLPLFLTIVAGAAGSLGDAGNWCWIKEDAELVRFFCYYLELIAAMIFVSVIYWRISKSVSESAQRSTINFRLRLYLFVFIAIRFFSVLNRVADWISSEKLFALYMLQSIFEPLQGVGNAIVYGLNRQVAQQYREAFHRRFITKCGGSDDGDVPEGPSSAPVQSPSV